jgi:hypothetical protein
MVVQMAAYSKMERTEVQPGGEAVMDSRTLLLPRRVKPQWPSSVGCATRSILRLRRDGTSNSARHWQRQTLDGPCDPPQVAESPAIRRLPRELNFPW